MTEKQIISQKEFLKVMNLIESLLKKADEIGGFDNLSANDKKNLASWSLKVEQFEDNIPLMPIKATKSLSDMLRYKMFEKGLKQKQLASILEISEATISGLLSGRRKLSIELAKKLHTKLDIDAQFLLMSA